MRETLKPLTHFLARLGSLLAPARPRGPADRVVLPWRDDALRAYPSVGLTPSRALAMLQSADAGAPETLFELYRDMLQKWPRLAAVEATRRLALTGLEWDIAPARQRGNMGDRSPTGLCRNVGDRFPTGLFTLEPQTIPSASPQPHGTEEETGRRPVPHTIPQTRDDVAAFCRETLDAIENLDAVLDHLASAIGFGIAVAEIVWDRGRVVALEPVPWSRLVADVHEPWRLRVLTESDPSIGVALDEQPAKWIVHRPRTALGRLFDGGLLRSSLLLFLAQNTSFKDWLAYSQIAGMPVRVAQFEPGTPEAERRALLRVMETLGTQAAAVMSKAVELRFLESSRSDKPYEALQEYCNTEVTILWLGQHLTTDIKNSGSRAAAEVHDRVREDLLVDDMRDEAATLRRDLLRPMVEARFGPAAVVPEFRRSLVESIDTKTLAQTLAVASRELRMRIPRAWAHRSLGIPEAAAGEAVLESTEDRR
ncbi:MAG: DUF935 family protein [Phycisphaerales bacterium]|nr:DUF935 family protein [Phycisphaerales bacterium]